MNILLVSSCSKRARTETCRILDRFAERKGDATWQTTITLEGLNTLRRLLRKTARRNTAVACHWLKKEGRSELMWIVGNLRCFDAQGNAPTHSTSRDILRAEDEHAWHTSGAIGLMAALAALFHDFGKANNAFQNSVQGKGKHNFQPYRHEWVSLRLFLAFVGNKTDAEWLTALTQTSACDDARLLRQVKKDDINSDDDDIHRSPLRALPALAKAIGWLILSHHRLPQALEGNPALKYSATWMDNQLNADWNSRNQYYDEWKKTDRASVWKFKAGTPLQSRTWREKARQIAQRALNVPSLYDAASMDRVFTLHMARLTLMLADHHYSSQSPVPAWQDEAYPLWANSEKTSSGRQMRQTLDEHLCGVAHHALLLGRTLPQTVRRFPTLARHAGFRQRVAQTRFRWQNQAWDVACSLRERARQQGFFGINMASTGCGKTFANARIMYALANEQTGCRFSVALGLRTLTLQTGQALRARLHLDDDVLAVLTGSAAVRELQQGSPAPDDNSQSADALFEAHQYVHFEGTVQSGLLQQWLSKDDKLQRLVCAPILVTTIDHLITATEGVRGGKQLPAMLRLLSSDLVLDEPDDFDIADLHAQCRLVNWSGMLGARVLLSSATLPPAHVEALFEAYLEGRRAFQRDCGEPGLPVNICCAWFDEDNARSHDIAGTEDFKEAHRDFARQRARRLPEQAKLRLGNIADVVAPQATKSAASDAVADAVMQHMLALDAGHHMLHSSGKTVSLGLVRFANINPLVAVAQRLMAQSPPENCCIHYCVYHGQHPLAVRSFIEARLDKAFDRHHPEQLWQLPEVSQALRQNPARRHLFVVLATSVVEVGRDWDADWGIIEPSSMRSLIQFAGRIQRHRACVPTSANMVILSHNINALSGKSPAYTQPGYETKAHLLKSHDVRELLPEDVYRNITAVARIVEDDTHKNALASLEHQRLRSELLGPVDTAENLPLAASLWWRGGLTWCGELQRRTPFRRSSPQAQFFIYMEDEGDEPVFRFKTPTGDWKTADRFKEQPLTMAKGVQPWFNVDYRHVLTALAEEKQMELNAVCTRYGEITLRVGYQDAEEDWLFNPLSGVFRALR